MAKHEGQDNKGCRNKYCQVVWGPTDQFEWSYSEMERWEHGDLHALYLADIHKDPLHKDCYGMKD